MGKKIQCIGRYVMDGQTLGKGNFARVELATHSITGCKVAIKIIDTRKIKEEYTRTNLHREARILGQIRHPHIIRLYETLKATTLYCLVLEYASGGDLLAFIKSQKESRLPEIKARMFFRQLVSAMHFLHERGVAHRDLKMENILLDSKHKNLKIIDFGLSNTFSRSEMMKTHCGSLEYAAPELIATNDKYGPEVDIWSLGIILYGMVIGKLPFSTHYTDQYRRQKLLVQIEKGLAESHFKELEMLGISKELADLLNKLIEPSVELRLPLTECEVHTWVTNHNKIPFTPFVALPRDKASKLQVIDELAELLEAPREQVEETVSESKCDDFSAMFNMLLDIKRSEKGMFDMDFTQKQEVKKEKVRRKHHHRSAARKDNKTKLAINVRSTIPNHIKENPQPQSNDTYLESPEPVCGPYHVWEELVKATPAILCPDIEIPSDGEVEHKIVQSHNSTNFDLMALCSAPTWLGGDRRKSRRRRSPMPPLTPVPPADGSKGEADSGAAGGHDPHGLLSPTTASTQVAQLLRRNSSRRRTRKGAQSADPPSRTGSFRRSSSRRRNRPETPGSGPNSPASPQNANNPEIKIDTPKQSPISAVKRPANLKGLKECYPSDPPKGLLRKSTLGPHTSYSRKFRRTRFGSDQTDGGDSVQSDSSNPCSTTNLQEDYSDGSQEMLSLHGSKLSVASGDHREQTVESKIAHADIRSIVRPKQIVLRSKVNGHVSRNNPCNLLVPQTEDASGRHIAASPEIIIESMQPNTTVNLSDDEKLERRMSCEIPQTDSEKRVVLSDSLTVNLRNPESIHSSVELLGAVSLKPRDERAGICNDISVSVSDLCRSEHYANHNGLEISEHRDVHKEHVDLYDYMRGPAHLVADLYSKREKISLDDKILMQDDICYVDSSDHNSSQENVLLNRRRLKDSVTSDDFESFSAPTLLSPLDIGLGLTPKESPGDSLIGPGATSLSSRHGSTPSVRFVMPSTPIRQMFKTPIARVESFHSDDFENYTSDFDALVTSPNTPSPSSISTQTPTVHCFQYKLHSRRKKNLKHHHKTTKAHKDGIVSFIPEKHGRDDIRGHDGLMSSGSECGSDGQVDKAVNASKSKIFPMENSSDDQNDGKVHKPQMNDKNRMISDSTITQNSTKKVQNSTCKSLPWNQAPDTETKHSIWSRGFVRLLKKKKLTGHNSSGNNNNDAENHSRYPSSKDNGNTNNTNNTNNSNNTNNTKVTSNTINLVNNTRNGHARAIPPCTLDIPVTSVDIKWSPAKVVQNNIKASVETGTGDISRSETPSPSPSKPKVFDFTIVSSEPQKHKHCLLSWKTCRHCTFSDEPSSTEGSEDNECSVHDNLIPESANGTTVAITTIFKNPPSPCVVLQT